MKKLFFALAAGVIAAGLAYVGMSARPMPPSSATDVSVAPAVSPPTSTATTVTSLSTSVSTSTAPASPPLTPEQFRERAQLVLDGLPKIAELRALPASETQHGTPRPVLEAGAAIGEIADAIDRNPALAPEGLEFYGKCAHGADLSLSARALCLANQRELARKQGEEPASEEGIPAAVTGLADKLR
jgi:hypothetical protein